MTHYLQYMDWKVILLALLAFYLFPSLLANELLGFLTDRSSVPAHVGRPAASYFAFFYLALPPVMAGYFAARFARHLPLMSALVLTLLGSALTAIYGPVTNQAIMAYAPICLALAMLGANMQWRGQGN